MFGLPLGYPNVLNTNVQCHCCASATHTLPLGSDKKMGVSQLQTPKQTGPKVVENRRWVSGMGVLRGGLLCCPHGLPQRFCRRLQVVAVQMAVAIQRHRSRRVTELALHHLNICASRDK